MRLGHNRDPAHAAFLHYVDDLGQRRALAHGRYFRCHQVLNLAAVGLDVVFGVLFGAAQEIEPAGTPPLSTYFGPAQKVTFGQHPERKP